MKCLFLIFPFAYLYIPVKIFVPAEYGNITLIRFKMFSSWFVYVLGFYSPDHNYSEYVL